MVITILGYDHQPIVFQFYHNQTLPNSSMSGVYGFEWGDAIGKAEHLQRSAM